MRHAHVGIEKVENPSDRVVDHSRALPDYDYRKRLQSLQIIDIDKVDHSS
jgi:hypothetical protein